MNDPIAASVSEGRKRAAKESALRQLHWVPVLLFLSAVKLICEIALLSLVGQGLLYVLAGSKRDTNFFYQLLQLLTRPFTKVARKLTPRLVADRHVPFVVLFMLAVLWAIVTIEKIRYCVGVGMEGCR